MAKKAMDNIEVKMGDPTWVIPAINNLTTYSTDELVDPEGKFSKYAIQTYGKLGYFTGTESDDDYELKGVIDCKDPILSEEIQALRRKIYDMNPKGRRYGTDIISAHVYTRDFDNDCREDMLTGKGFRISNHESFDKKNQKIPDGLQSPEFGSDFGDDLEFAERYRCVCGLKMGQMYEHEICPECNTEVQYCEVDLEKTGWIFIEGGFKVITPIYYAKLEALLGKYDSQESVIGAIIRCNYKDAKTNEELDEAGLTDRDREMIVKHPFIRKGMAWFEQHILEVLDFYRRAKPGKAKWFEEIIDNIDKVFCSRIPVYTSVLRMEAPGAKDEKVFRTKTNTCYRSIIRSANMINDLVARHYVKNADDDAHFTTTYDISEMTSIDRFSAQIQKDLKDLFEEEFTILSGKEGYILGKVVSGRYNFSARNIIISGGADLHSDEIMVCYSTFIELFRYELTAYYAKYNNCTISEANDAILKAQSRFDKQVYYTMLYMVNTNDIHVIVNRNPSINYGSFLALRIVHVKSDIGDRTLTVNKRILIVMGADFDGDQENIFRVFGDSLNATIARQMNPRYTLFIDKKNNQLNRALMPTKDEAIGFYTFNNI